MGYYTYYSLCLYGKDEDVKACEDTIRNEVYDKELMSTLVEGESIEAKWYEWEKDMDRVAEKHPDVFIRLFGDGEESDDKWECRWYQGKKEYHCVEMPPFTEVQLSAEKEQVL